MPDNDESAQCTNKYHSNNITIFTGADSAAITTLVSTILEFLLVRPGPQENCCTKFHTPDAIHSSRKHMKQKKDFQKM